MSNTNQRVAGEFPAVTEGANLTVAGPTRGVADATVSTTNWQALTLSMYVGKNVKAYCEGSDIYFCFVTDSGVTPSITSVSDLPVADRLFLGTKERMVVPGSRYIVKYRAVSGTGNVLRFIRA